jgi:cell division protein ZipA
MTLQLGLLVVGIFIVAVVALTAYDRGRIGRSARRLNFPSAGAAAVTVRREPVAQVEPGKAPEFDAGRFLKSDPEPALDLAYEDEKSSITDELAEIEETANRTLNLNPGFDPPGTGADAMGVPEHQRFPNEAIDFVIYLPGPGPTRRRSALSVYKQNEYKLEYPRQLYGQRYQTSFWSIVQHDSDATQYADFKLAIQLVDERGPINETELNTFVQVGLKLADALQRPSKFSMPFEQAIERGRMLAAFCDEYDVIAGVNVVTEPHTPFRGNDIVAIMAAESMSFDPRSIFHKRDGDRVLYSMSNMFKPGTFDPATWDAFRTPGLTLFMSVPSVSDPVNVFDRMIATARAVTSRLGGRLLDQDRRPLTDKGVAAIRAQIHGIEVKMRQFGIAPGSEAAKRLFGTDL